ncbi:helicase/SANT-associated, DNA binding protein [Actinidia rufa]|uniref:Helicase/SANT-associated, DNA binding protein n=1 Tax=Actinidia rufa TaxID=165716 RepID=A0A7J0FMA0_9ERIC|nr:helicase/SANT-associated, DNA binding protein [Actinidia rufa]
MSLKALVPDTRSDAELDGAQAVESTTGLTKVGLPESAPDFNTSRSLQDKQHNQHSQVDTRETSAMASGLPESVAGRKQVVSGGLVCPPHASTAKAENKTSSGQLNGFSNAKGDRKSISNECQSSNATFRAKCLDSEFSCTQNNLSLDGNNDSDPCKNFRNIDSNGNTKEQALESEGTLSMEGNEILKNEKKSLDNHVFSNDEHDSVHQSPQGNVSIFGIKEELHRSTCGLQNEVKCFTSSETVELAGNSALKTERKPGDSLTDNLDVPKENDITGRPQGALDSSIHDSSDPRRESAGGRLQSSMDPSILGLSGAALSVKGSTGAREQQSSEIYSKLANKALEDSILEEARIIKKIVAHTLAKAIMEFWHSSEEKSKKPELQCPGKDFSSAVQGYAVVPKEEDKTMWKLSYASRIFFALAQKDRSLVKRELHLSSCESSIYVLPSVLDNIYNWWALENAVLLVNRSGLIIESGFTHEQRWLDNSFRNEQRDPSRKRLDNYQLESNGSSGLFSQHIMKKPKMMKQSLDNSFDNLTPISGSIPSPVASQMSNMSNPNKLIKILGGRDRGRKSKSLKALVVLVHDMGPNWELISDAINSTLQFKCIFRKPKDCKERHKILMDGTVGDGADSAEDSGFEFVPYYDCLFLKNDNQDAKPIQPHNSHTLALSQVFPNNLNEGPPLTPFDLCDTTASSPDVLSPGYQGSQAGGLAISNQGTVASVLPASATNSSIHGSSNVALGNNFSSPSSPLNASVRDGRYGVPRSASLSIDGQQRMQQYNHMLSGRNIQQSAPAVSGAPPGTDRGVRILPGGNGVGIVSGLNRTMPMARPRFQEIAPPSMTSGSMITSSMAVMPSPVNVPPGVGSGQGNAMLRPRNTLNMMRPGQNAEHQRQMMVPELQMQAGQGSNQGWKTPEQVSDSGVANPATQLAPIGSPPLTNSAGSEPMPTVSQGLGHIVGAQWRQQQQQSQLQPPSTPSPPLPQQQQQSPQKQLPPPPPSQQQTQHLQAGNNSLSIRPHQL